MSHDPLAYTPFEAQYPSFCIDCGYDIEVGEHIKKSRGEWVHADCGRPPFQEAPPCPKCFLTTCDCERES